MIVAWEIELNVEVIDFLYLVFEYTYTEDQIKGYKIKQIIVTPMYWQIRNNNCSTVNLIILNFMINVLAIEMKDSYNNQIYILIWTRSESSPFQYMVKERMQKCYYKNCFVTNKKAYLEDIKDFDVVLFDAVYFQKVNLPDKRSKHQKYIFVSHEPSALHPVSFEYNEVFNYTWTYKLISDITLKYLLVKDKNGKVIGPRSDIRWIDNKDMKPISQKIKHKLQNKYKAAAWFVSHCITPNGRWDFILSLSNVLKQYGLRVDIFGPCGELECDQDSEECHVILEKDYYFYLAFENSMCEDYVTEKILTATKHFTVPIVYGGADYKRFLPQGSYIDAYALGQEKLAYIMNDTIHNQNKYYDYFKWHRYYSFHDPSETPETDEICSLCTFLNNERNTNRISVYENISAFWST